MEALYAYKSSDQSVTSSTTLVSDNALFLPVVANATYDFFCYLNYTGGTQGSSDIKLQWTVPPGRRCASSRSESAPAAAWASGTPTAPRPRSALGTQGSGTLCGATMIGTLIMSSTAGTLQMEWAQNSSNATATTVKAQSLLRLYQARVTMTSAAQTGGPPNSGKEAKCVGTTC